MNHAMKFEYEWMEDESLRVRFLSSGDAIIGQQIIASEAINAFAILVSLAFARHVGMEPENLMPRFSGFEMDTSQLALLLEAVRVRVEVNPKGGFTLEAIDDE